MKLARLASFVHKWLALIVGVQIVFWIVSGLFFTIFPIERIRSEHLVRPVQVAALDLAALGDLSTIRDEQSHAPVKLTIEHRASGDMIVAEFPEGSPALFEAGSLRRLSPLDEATATRIARAHVTLAAAPRGVDLVTSESAEYRGALPAWRVDFADGGLSVYVAAKYRRGHGAAF